MSSVPSWKGNNVIRFIKLYFIEHFRGSETCVVPLRFAEAAVAFGSPDAEVRTNAVRWPMWGHLPAQTPVGNGCIPAFKTLRLTSRDTMSDNMVYTPSHTPPSSQLSYLETQRDGLRDSQCTASQFITVATDSLLSPYQWQNFTSVWGYAIDLINAQSWLADYLIWNSNEYRVQSRL